VIAKLANRNKERVVDSKVEEQFSTGRVLACISSRPGQCGRVDGYILEGAELQFYLKKIDKKK
jgi:small subunit ribosomal protein S8e